MNSKITIAIPNTGRMCAESLEWLAKIGLLDKAWQENVAKALEISRQEEWQVQNELIELWKGSPLEGLTKTYDPRSGWRVSFAAKQTDSFVWLVGMEKPTTNAITQGIGDIAIIGFDELLAAFAPYFSWSKKVRGWDAFNEALRPQSTDARYAGVTGIEDYAGLFLISSSAWTKFNLEKVRRGEIQVAVKPQYEGLLYYLLGKKVSARPVKDLEAEVTKNYCLGFDVVRTGETIIRNDLRIIGKPLLYTKSVVVVDKGRYEGNASIRETANYLTQRNCTKLEDWEAGLKEKLGGRWLR